MSVVMLRFLPTIYFLTSMPWLEVRTQLEA